LGLGTWDTWETATDVAGEPQRCELYHIDGHLRRADLGQEENPGRKTVAWISDHSKLSRLPL
jgi:hypothetical protein